MSRIELHLILVTSMLVTASLAPQRALSWQEPRADRFDLILRNGLVLDGTGAAPFRADVAISDRFIARVGQLGEATAEHDLDVAGLYVAPGFINLHSHASPQALATAENMLTQGVTTEILNADGGGRTDIAHQLAEAAAEGLALHIGANVGFNSAWASVVGEADRRPTAQDASAMREILVRNLEWGAWGVSAGLDYKPAYFATTEEVIDIIRAAAPWRTNFTNHDRVTPETNYSSRAGMAETIGIGARAGLVPVITHMKVQGREQGTADEILRLMREATARGSYTAADAYPYLAGQTGLAALLIPGWAQDGGREPMLERFKDPETRRRIVAETEDAMTARFGGPAGVYLPATNRELTDVMREMNVAAGEAVVRLLEESNQGVILRFGAEADLVKILQHPSTAIACDCGAGLPGRASHPRYYGTYPRVLGHYVRETAALTWPDAVRKMTLLPATTIGMVDRGAIAPGMVADITVFDPATVIDHATFEAPTRPSAGIRHVLVNGGFALRDGAPTGERLGRVLRRARYMPSRPLDTDRTRTLSVSGMLQAPGDVPEQAIRVAIDLTQAPHSRAATGTAQWLDARKRPAIEIVELGLLQTAPGWASFTARGRMLPSREERSIVVVVEQSDPWLPDKSPSITVVIDGTLESTGRATPGSVRISGS